MWYRCKYLSNWQVPRENIYLLHLRNISAILSQSLNATVPETYVLPRDGTVPGSPTDTDENSITSYIMLYRKDMWAAAVQAGVLQPWLPATWDELIDTMQRLVSIQSIYVQGRSGAGVAQRGRGNGAHITSNFPNP